MAVHTVLSSGEIEALCRFFDLASLRAHEGIASGSINTNYALTTEKGRFFLTLREGKRRGDVEDEVRLLTHLADARFPVSRPIVGMQGPIAMSHDLPALCFPWLAGEELSASQIQPDHSREVGEHLGRMHVLCESLPFDRPNPYRMETLRQWLDSLAGISHREIANLLPELEDEYAWLKSHRDHGLPRGVIHADLFIDNTKWIGGRLSAIYDFEMACRDILALDLAIVLLSWCFAEETFDHARVRALVTGYQTKRKLNSDERQGLFAEARFGALRYTLSRIRDFELSPLPAERLFRKDFRRYLARLRALRALGPLGFGEIVG